MSFLIDTDTCSGYLKGNQRVFNRFIQHSGGLYISAIALSELYSWALRANAPSRRLATLQDLLNDLRVLSVDGAVARRCGEIRAALLVRPRTNDTHA